MAGDPETVLVRQPRFSTPILGFGEDALVVVFVGGDDVVGAVFLFGIDAGGLAHLAVAAGTGQDFEGVARGFLHIADVNRAS